MNLSLVSVRRSDMCFWLLSAWVIAGCADGRDCPAGTKQLGNRCAPVLGDASEPAAGDDPDASGGGERADAGQEGDDEELDSEADPEAPDTPAISAAESMAPGRELWTWTVPEGTDHFELRLDGEAPAVGASADTPRYTAPLEPGDHTLEVRTCDARGRCSDWASRGARVESFGRDLPRGLRDSARALASTGLGHRVAIGCSDCADGPNAEVYNLDAAAASLERALERGADLVELNVASIAGGLYASPADSASAGARPLLSTLLARPALADSDALIALEVVEGGSETIDKLLPDDFAAALFDVLDAAPSVARNGRALWLRTSYEQRQYLQALANEAARRTVTGPYVRFIVGDPGREPDAFYGDEALVPQLAFVDAVAVDFRRPNLASRLERARAAQSAVVLDNIPGPGHGELVLGALREQADVFLTSYRVDQARAIVTKADAAAWFAAQDISADGRVLTVHGMRSGALVRWQRELSPQVYSSPWWGAGSEVNAPRAVLDDEEGLFFGPYLSLEADDTSTSLPLMDAAYAAEPSAGFLFSFEGTLPDADPAALIFSSLPASGPAPFGSYIVSLGVSSTLGASLSYGSDTAQRIQISVPLEGATGCTSRNQPFTAALKSGAPHWIVLAYQTASRELVLLIDGMCAARALVPTIPRQDFVAKTVLGSFAESHLAAVQQFAALRWEPAPEDAEN